MIPMNEVSLRTLEETSARAIPLLRAIATRVEIRATMFGAGYSDEEQAEGWRLVLLSAGYVAPRLAQADDERARAAIAALDAWDEPGFRRVHAALERLHPEQDEFVFRGLGAAQGAGAVLSVALLLERLDALESSPERAETREADHAALATLEKRGIGKAERMRLAGLVQSAQAVTEPLVPQVAPTAAEREAALKALRSWYRDWSETARAVIRRRDHLILMGLAHRRYTEAETEETVADDETAMTPAAI